MGAAPPPPPEFWRKYSKEDGKERKWSEKDSIWFKTVKYQVENAVVELIYLSIIYDLKYHLSTLFLE